MFDPIIKDWTTYTDRMKYYFIANDTADVDKKYSVLLLACRPATYEVNQNLVEDGKLSTMSYNDIVKLMKGYYDLLPSVTVQRYKFNTCIRSTSETFADYVATLREIAQHCEYKNLLHKICSGTGWCAE